MNDLDIIKQLLNGNHLEPKELKRADWLLKQMKVALESRIEKVEA